MKDVAVVAYCRTGIARATRGALGVVVSSRVAGRLIHHRRRMMTAHVEESADLIVSPAHDDDGLAANVREVFTVTGFDTILDIEPDPAAAVVRGEGAALLQERRKRFSHARGG